MSPEPASLQNPENPVTPATLVLSWEDSALQARRTIREAFSDRHFTFRDSRPWLVALENGSEFDPSREVLRLEEVLQHLWSTFCSDFDALHFSTPVHALPIVVFKDRDSFDDYCLSRPGGKVLPAAVRGFYEQTRRRTITYWADPPPLDRLRHEGIHQLVHEFSTEPMQSLWFHEGLGSFYEPVPASGSPAGPSPWINPQRLADAKRAISDRELRSRVYLRDLLNHTVDTFSRWYSSQSDGAVRDQISTAFYGISWGLVHYLLRSGKPEYRSLLQDYFLLETRAKGGREAFERLLREKTGKDLDQLQEEIVPFLQSLK